MSRIQTRVENFVYECIDEIAEELDLTFQYYPEVYWTRNKKFSDLSLPDSYRRDFNILKRERRNFYSPDLNIIFINIYKEPLIAEEAGHFLHFTNSKINHSKKEAVEKVVLKIIAEALAFFASKLICPDRENEFKDKSYILNLEKISSRRKFKLKETNLIYAMGYSLGERLFQYYIAGEVSKEYIKKLFKKKFTKKHEPLLIFFNLKYMLGYK